MKKSFLILLLFIFIISCETVIDIDIPVEPPQIVINSTLSDGDYIKVHLSESQHILDANEFNPIRGAEVKIFEDGNLLETLPDSLGGYYISGINKIKRGNTYDINVSKAGFLEASSSVYVPKDTVEILSVKTDTVLINDFGYTVTYLRLSVEFKDDKNLENYYDVSVYESGFYKNYDYSFDPPLLIDSTYYYNIAYIESRDPNLEDFQSYGTNILFDDKLFNGSTYHMNILINLYDYDTYPNPDTPTYFVELSNTSESYFRYEMSSQSQYWNSDNPFAQPVTVYNNIENGFGIFGAYNTGMFKVE